MKIFSGKLKHMGFIKEIIQKNKVFFGLIVFFNVLVGTLGLVLPYFSKLQIEQLQAKHQELFGLIYSSPLNLFIVLLVVVALINLLTEFITQMKARLRKKLDFMASVELEKKLLNKLETFDISFLNNPRNSSISDSVFSSTYFFSDLLYYFEDIIRSLMSLGVLPIAFFLDKTLFLVICIFGVLEIIINFWWQQYNVKMDALLELQKTSNSRLRWSLFYYLDKLIPMNAQETLFEKVMQDKKNAFKLSYGLDVTKDRVQMLMNVFKEIPSLIVGGLIAVKVFAGTASLGDFTMISMYATQLSSMFSSLSWVLRRSQTLIIDMSRINFFFSLKERIIAPLVKKEMVVQGNVEFKNLSFHYPVLDEEERAYLKEVIALNQKAMSRMKTYQYDKDKMKRWNELLEDTSKPPREVLQGVNLSIQKGRITSLIGRNGAGKTTSANLLVKGYSPTGGEILIDGININDFLAAEIRKNVSMIHQSPLLLNGLSIKDNLLLGVERSVSDEEIWQWLERVQLSQFIKSQPKRLDTICGEETSFSGGQIQLLAIVRVILQDRKIIIFDEGTNQLDAEHEAIIIKIIKELKEKKAIFIITHKMTTARHSDKIYVMDDGQIVEEGSHQSLLGIEDGIYKKFWELQVVN